MSELSATKGAQRNIVKALIALIWVYGGRGMGLLWTLVLTSQLGIHNYGLYGMAIALNAIVGPSLDNPFLVRAVRESEERFLAERTCRYLMALTLIVPGLIILPAVYFVGFGLIVAGGEIALNVVKSRSYRDGHPDRVSRIDAARQTTSVAVGSAYLFAVHTPSLTTASLLYCTPYVVSVILGGVAACKHRPAIPGPPRLIAALSGEMLGTAAYLQGDVLLLGWLTNSTIVGYYTLTWVVSAAVVAVGQSFAVTYHEPLRESGGDLSAAPPLRVTLGIATASGAVMLLIGLGLFVSPAPTQLAVAMMIMSGFVALRTVTCVLQVVLYTQRRDLFRFTAAVGLVPFKFAILATLSFAGAIGAAIATTTTDALLLVVYATALYRTKRT